MIPQGSQSYASHRPALARSILQKLCGACSKWLCKASLDMQATLSQIQYAWWVWG